MLVNGFHLQRKIRTVGKINTNRTGSDIAFLATFGETETSTHAVFVIYNDGVALYVDMDSGLAYTNNEDFAKSLESQTQG